MENKITQLTPRTFNGLVVINRIRLEDNSLTTLDSSAFSQLPRTLRLGLERNPLDCNTTLCWLQYENEDGAIVWFEDKPTCSNGTDWDDMYCVERSKYLVEK